MKKILQKVVASDGNGDCVRAAVASVLDLEYDDVPDMCPNTGNQAGILMDFMKQNDYEYNGVLYNPKYYILYYTNQFDYCCRGLEILPEFIMNSENVTNLNGINGLFLATVLSPKFTSPYEGKWGHHMVICDKEFNVVFDPGPEYQDIINYPLSELLGSNGICYIDVYEKKN